MATSNSTTATAPPSPTLYPQVGNYTAHLAQEISPIESVPDLDFDHFPDNESLRWPSFDNENERQALPEDVLHGVYQPAVQCQGQMYGGQDWWTGYDLEQKVAALAGHTEQTGNEQFHWYTGVNVSGHYRRNL